jgi:uncharacterized coiled-coil protein SlyX
MRLTLDDLTQEQVETLSKRGHKPGVCPFFDNGDISHCVEACYYGTTSSYLAPYDATRPISRHNRPDDLIVAMRGPHQRCIQKDRDFDGCKIVTAYKDAQYSNIFSYPVQSKLTHTYTYTYLDKVKQLIPMSARDDEAGKKIEELERKVNLQTTLIDKLSTLIKLDERAIADLQNNADHLDNRIATLGYAIRMRR